jgi:hypothetical protein
MGAMMFWASRELARCFVVIWIGGVAAFLAIAVAEKTRPEVAGRMARRMGKTMIYVVATYLAATFAVHTWCKRIVVSEFNESLSSSLSSIRFVVAGKATVVTDPQEIDAFRRAIMLASSVHAHHSSPTEEIEFTLKLPSEVYSVGKDSNVDQEFWIMLERSRYELMHQEVMQIRSPELAAWLARTFPPAKR